MTNLNSPLTTLVSEVLVAFTIEADNHFEQQMNASPHRPFLVSLVMGNNFLHFVPEAGITVRELSLKTGLPAKVVHPSLPGMTRWGYVKTEANSGAKPSRMDEVITLTPAGQTAQAIWQTLPETIEERWNQRFGPDLITTLKSSLAALLDQDSSKMPLYLPVLMNQGFKAPNYVCKPDDLLPNADGDKIWLSTLLSRVLLSLTLEFEQTAEVSLPISVNVLWVLTAEGVLLRDLPKQSGISKQAINMALTYLLKQGYVTQADGSGKEGKSIYLTPTGQAAQTQTQTQLKELEQRWSERFPEALKTLRETLLNIIQHQQFSAGLIPPEGCWRGLKPFINQTQAVIENPEKLPHYPMVLHRGGYPDGS